MLIYKSQQQQKHRLDCCYSSCCTSLIVDNRIYLDNNNQYVNKMLLPHNPTVYGVANLSYKDPAKKIKKGAFVAFNKLFS